MSGTSYRGISADQDPRFKDKTALGLKALQSSGKLPAHYATRVDMRKVAMPVMRTWIDKRVEELLGFEDDVVAEYAVGLLQVEGEYYPDPKTLQLSLTGFLSTSAPVFVSELWSLLISAQNSIGGIPQEFVEAKKKEMAEARAKDKGAIQGSQRYAPGGRDAGDGGRRAGTGANTAPISRNSRWGPTESGRNDGPPPRHLPRRPSPPPARPGSMMYPVGQRGEEERHHGNRGRGGGHGGGGGRDWARDRDRDRDDGPPPRWGTYAATSSGPRRADEHDDYARRRDADRSDDSRRRPRYDSPDRTRQRSRYDEPPSSRRDDRRGARDRSDTPPYRSRRSLSRSRSRSPPPRRRDERPRDAGSGARKRSASPLSSPRDRGRRADVPQNHNERSVSPLSRSASRSLSRSRSRSPDVPPRKSSKWDKD